MEKPLIFWPYSKRWNFKFHIWFSISIDWILVLWLAHSYLGSRKPSGVSMYTGFEKNRKNSLTVSFLSIFWTSNKQKKKLLFSIGKGRFRIFQKIDFVPGFPGIQNIPLRCFELCPAESGCLIHRNNNSNFTYLSPLYTGAVCSKYEENLLASLFSQYNPAARPVQNDSNPVIVKFGMTLSQIIDVVRVHVSFA